MLSPPAAGDFPGSASSTRSITTVMTAPSPSYSWNVDPFASSSVWATVPSPPLASTSSSSPPPTKPAAPEEDTWDADSNHDASPAFEDRARATEDAFEVEEEDDFAEPMGEGDDDFGDFDDGEAFPEAAEEPAQPEVRSSLSCCLLPTCESSHRPRRSLSYGLA